jgi:hypothetical protein
VFVQVRSPGHDKSNETSVPTGNSGRERSSALSINICISLEKLFHFHVSQCQRAVQGSVHTVTEPPRNDKAIKKSRAQMVFEATCAEIQRKSHIKRIDYHAAIGMVYFDPIKIGYAWGGLFRGGGEL